MESSLWKVPAELKFSKNKRGTIDISGLLKIESVLILEEEEEEAKISHASLRVLSKSNATYLMCDQKLT